MTRARHDDLGNHPEGRPSPAELSAWLAELDAGERMEMEQAWKLAELGRAPEPDVQATTLAWEQLEETLDAPSGPVLKDLARKHERLSRPQRRPSGGRMIPLWVSAAAVVIFIGVGGWWWMRPVTLHGVVDGVARHTLPDGSRVELNSGATLTYRRSFGGAPRAVSLAGEGFFEVTHEAERPFVVETFNAVVTVVGTQFGVRAWPGDPAPETAVVLEEGAVRLEGRGEGGRGVLLAPGQMSRVVADAAPTAPEAVAVARVLAWRSGGFYFNDQPLAVILADIERRYGLRIEVPPALAQDSLVLFHDRPENVEVLLEAVSSPRGYRYRVTTHGYELLPPNTP